MFERYITILVQTLLRRHFKNVVSSDLRFRLGGGDVHVEDVELVEPAVVETLGLDALDCRKGSIKSLDLSIPWGALTSRPARLVVDDVTIDLEPRRSRDRPGVGGRDLTEEDIFDEYTELATQMEEEDAMSEGSFFPSGQKEDGM
jgi:hypothetical protein